MELSGSVEGFNYGPAGNYDSLMLKSGDKLVQINFPPPLGASLGQSVAKGDQVHLSAVPEKGPKEAADHPIYRLQSLTTAKGQQIATAEPHQDRGPAAHVEGTVQRMNYGHHGEVNGVILDNGDFVHIGPREATELKLAVGQKLTADGVSHPLPQGHQAIDAQSVNGAAIKHPKPGGPGERGPKPPRP
jgi:hypothetical protein